MFYIYLTIGIGLVGILTLPKKKKEPSKVKALKNFYAGPNRMKLSIAEGEVYEVKQTSKDGTKYLLALPNDEGSFGWTNKKDYEIVE